MGATIPEESVFTAAVKTHIDAWSFRKSALITDTTAGKLKGLLQDAIDNGWGNQKLGQAVRQMFDDTTPARALATARTEMTGAIGYGTHETLKAEGQTEHEWSTVTDGRERDSHFDANGQVQPIDQPFKLAGGNAMFPGDPNLPPEESVNCRCAETMAGLSEDRKRRLYDAFLRLHGALENRLVVSLRRHFEQQRDRVLSHFPA